MHFFTCHVTYTEYGLTAESDYPWELWKANHLVIISNNKPPSNKKPLRIVSKKDIISNYSWGIFNYREEKSPGSDLTVRNH